MRLEDLISGINTMEITGDIGIDITGVAYNSRNVKEGDIFAAIPGTLEDGAKYIPDALSSGASAILSSRPVETGGAPLIRVEDVRLAMGQLAGRLLGNPSHQLNLVAITGTNGKTTVSYILEAISNAAGAGTGVIGTVNYRYGDIVKPARTTTPESVDIQEMLLEMRKTKISNVFIEVSSHALHQKRVAGLSFSQAIFTNLSQDHLDYHLDMESYFAAKKRLFTEVLPGGWDIDRTRHANPGVAVINVDDNYGRLLAKELDGGCVTYGLDEPGAMIKGEVISVTGNGIEMKLRSDKGEFTIKSPLLGRHNASNIAAAAASALVAGIEPGAITKGVASLGCVPGRLEPVANSAGILAMVDYAHTPDALAKALQAVRELVKARLVLVFGCGGDRDRAKRPMMGKVAAEKADIVIVTSDNPRSEDPMSIIREIAPGIQAGALNKVENPADAQKGWLIEADRAAAIVLAVEASRPGDALLIAGKGHEAYQILGSRKIHFDDREVAAKALAGKADKKGKS